MKDILIGKTIDELTQVALDNGFRRFVGAQLADWIYKKRVRSFDEITNLSIKARDTLAQNYEIGYAAPVDVVSSNDGTRKYLFPTKNGNHVEAVYIPSQTSRTLCISSQAGCRMGCAFCMTGRMGFLENLTAVEIVNQIMGVDESTELTNVVFMGMGEPLDNMEHVLRAIEVITSAWGLAWSPTRITLSTVGMAKNLDTFLRQTRVSLAVSLHNPFHEERLKMMPVENSNAIEKTLEIVGNHDFTHHRRLSFEYIMFSEVNDTARHADELIRRLNLLKTPGGGTLNEVRVNLIRFHQIPDSPLRGSSAETIKWFNAYLNKAGILTTTRTSRGEDILAACGMLSASKQ
ncbi:MAG: 23S rRNA (adenine(2503)-C(2))-methyltransferase RlmN [Mucinivorans sp.]